MDVADTGSFIAERVGRDAPVDSALAKEGPDAPEALEAREEARLLGLYLRSLVSFFHLRNHPFSETEQQGRLKRDWSNELRIARRTLLQSSRHALQLISIQKTGGGEAVLEDADELDLHDEFTAAEASDDGDACVSNDSLVALAEQLASACAMCEAMLEAQAVSFHAWSSLGKILGRELEHSSAAQDFMRAADHESAGALQAPLITLAQSAIKPPALGADMLAVFTCLARLLERLRFIEQVLRRDQPLKSLLPVFTLVHEEARSLLEFMESRTMLIEGLDEAVLDALDGTNYAVSMELRKVFAHELVGLSALRQPPAIYAKVENAHGLLRDCFQQSTVALAQLFDPQLEGAQLFDAFQTKLQQSLALRQDLWTLLQLVRRAETERDQRPVAPLLARLAEFREGSLRYLMYKDWEACERFMEEVAAARGAIELSPVLHRFGAYLETLHSQVNMRAVLADHTFDYPPLES